MMRYILSTGNPRLNSNLLPDLEVLHCRPDLCDNTGALVSEHDGRLEDEVANTASLPVMYIAAADSGLGDLDAHVPGVFERRDGSVFERDILDGAQDEGGVCFLLIPLVFNYLRARYAPYSHCQDYTLIWDGFGSRMKSCDMDISSSPLLIPFEINKKKPADGIPRAPEQLCPSPLCNVTAAKAPGRVGRPTPFDCASEVWIYLP